MQSMTSITNRKPRSIRRTSGMTLLELMIACSILIVLATVAMPVARVAVKRHKEMLLEQDLRMMRDAIDEYKRDGDKGLIMAQASGQNYPPNLEALINAQASRMLTHNVRYLREVPVDPMTGNSDWKLRGVEDDADAVTWSGQDVFDVHSSSTATALNGTKYSDW